MALKEGSVKLNFDGSFRQGKGAGGVGCGGE